MKPLFTALLFILSISVQAQFYKFKCYQSAFCNENETPNALPESRYNNVDILITINIAERQIKTYGEVRGEYSLLKVLLNETESNGDLFSRYEGLDERGKGCIISMSIYADKSQDNIASVIMRYKTFALVFRLKKYE